eukprot:7444871-Prorocentrum_lima.AAC.1
MLVKLCCALLPIWVARDWDELVAWRPAKGPFQGAGVLHALRSLATRVGRLCCYARERCWEGWAMGWCPMCCDVRLEVIGCLHKLRWSE